ncbi:MAG: hypothetical protein JSR17_07015 [Proteobacteria bacterium]|nr:hypothetical protein [Pseudomonadota bacterium]
MPIALTIIEDQELYKKLSDHDLFVLGVKHVLVAEKLMYDNLVPSRLSPEAKQRFEFYRSYSLQDTQKDSQPFGLELYNSKIAARLMQVTSELKEEKSGKAYLR